MTLQDINHDLRELKKILRENGFPSNLISPIETRALRSGRRQTGIFRSNRQSRWTLIHDDAAQGTDPQYGTEEDCKTILIILLLTTLEFKNAPEIHDPKIVELSGRYLNRPLKQGSFRDALLLEFLDFQTLQRRSR